MAFIAAALPALSAIGAVVGAAGTVMGGMAQSQAASYQAAIAQNNATIAQQNATYATEAGAAKAQQAKGLSGARADRFSRAAQSTLC